MALRRLYQLLAKKETQAGVAAPTLIAAANADFLVIDPQLTIQPEHFDRANINRSSLSPFAPLAGVTTGQLAFQLELSGTGAATIPKWGLLLQAAGMRELATDAKEIGAITGGPFLHGETVTQATSLATGVVLHDTYDGAPRLYVHSKTGAWTATTGVITGGTSGATAPGLATALWAAGTSWQPDSTETLQSDYDSVTGTNSAGDAVKGGTSGAIAILGEAVAGGPGTFTMRVLDGTFTAGGETLDNLSQTGTIVTGAPAFVQTRLPALSMAVVEDGVAKQLKGCRGTWSLAGNIGEAMIFSFQFNGILQGDPIDAGTVTGVVFTAVVPPTMLGVTFSVGDLANTTEASEFSPRFQSISLDHANSVAIPRDAGEATGVFGSAHITSRASAGSTTVDVAPEGSYDFLAKLIDAEASRLRIDIGAAAGGNRFLITSPAAIFNSEGLGDQDGIGTRDLGFRLASQRLGTTERDDSEIVITYIADSTP